ncbi:hypothetical protein H0266_17345 [Halobacillus locisalis]|uniref:DUF4362 domain-containing protein n=1 Tax=Halobacillus locisalis TaxID=220753 RepID=A0A838CYV3_9BACI|nr:hypothetical protein [Halobacillus locisalis]MBA2176656.1 hypothetical protein [Halobacillus locisalis]
MKKLTLLVFLTFLTLAACSDTESEDTYSIEDARDNGDVIVEHQVDNFDQIMQGALEIENIDPITTLLDNYQQEETASADISIFSPDGSHFKNSLSYDGDVVTFENNYGGYKNAPQGTYTCEYIEKRGPVVYVSSCESDEGESYSTMIGFVGSENVF